MFKFLENLWILEKIVQSKCKPVCSTCMIVIAVHIHAAFDKYWFAIFSYYSVLITIYRLWIWNRNIVIQEYVHIMWHHTEEVIKVWYKEQIQSNRSLVAVPPPVMMHIMTMLMCGLTQKTVGVGVFTHIVFSVCWVCLLLSRCVWEKQATLHVDATCQENIPAGCKLTPKKWK